jgi:hypothetical protein
METFDVSIIWESPILGIIVFVSCVVVLALISSTPPRLGYILMPLVLAVFSVFVGGYLRNNLSHMTISLLVFFGTMACIEACRHMLKEAEGAWRYFLWVAIAAATLLALLDVVQLNLKYA